MSAVQSAPTFTPTGIATKRQPWGDEVLLERSETHTVKLLRRYGTYPFHRKGLQFHPDRSEVSHLVYGEAWFYWVDGETVCKRMLKAGQSVHIPSGLVHSFETVGDSLVVETSTPGTADAINVEDQYDVTTAVES